MGGVLTLSNTISGAGSLTKIGVSIARLEAANTYAGDTTISAGTLAPAPAPLGGVLDHDQSTRCSMSRRKAVSPPYRQDSDRCRRNGALTAANGAILRVGGMQHGHADRPQRQCLPRRRHLMSSMRPQDQ
jgi:autotransporter-associated beta strand protein